MGTSVEKYLEMCGCSHFNQVFDDNEIDEEAFLLLTMEDLRLLLPNKIGVQKKILQLIEQLRKDGKEHDVVTETVVKSATNSRSMGDYRGSVLDDHKGTRKYVEPSYLQNLTKTEVNKTPVANPIANSNSSQLPKSDILSKVASMLNRYSFPGDTATNFNVPSTSNNVSELSTMFGAVALEEIKPEPVNINKIEKPKKISSKILRHKEKLPIYAQKQKFLDMIKANQVLIVVGETGSGKSTQLTQYLHQAGFTTYGKIGCTQPRRIAAKSLAKRVAEEFGTDLGDKVGFRIRFENMSSNYTLITYMTDGILLQELATSPNIDMYAAIMLDEAHERSLNTDILFGLLKASLKKRPTMRVIITSATLDADKFSRYFNSAPIFEIQGRTFPVEVVYMGNPEPDYMNACVSTIMRIHRYEAQGDILVFLPGQEEIERCCDLLIGQDEKYELWVLPCYSALSLDEQNKVFEDMPEGYSRKVVVATNIAETSLTIDGIVYVVDSGVVKESEYDPRKCIKTLTVKPITKAQAIQRAGRAGRTKPGKVFRLYSEDRFNRMHKSPVPEIQRSNLESTILLLAAHGVENISSFDFIDSPASESISASLTDLQYLEALDSRGRLTHLGRQIAKFPLEPKLSKILIMSCKLNCIKEILTIVSILSVQSSTGKVFLRPKKTQFQADQAKLNFISPQGDHLTLLRAYDAWKSNYRSKDWCRKNYINFKALEEVEDIRNQLKSIMQSHDLKASLGGLSDPDAVQKALVSGYFNQVAQKMVKGHGYVTYANPNEKEPVFIHPSSALFKSAPSWIIYEELLNTGKKAYLINVVAIEPRWIQEYAPEFYKKLRVVFPRLMYM